MRGIPFTALEASFEQIEFVRKFGNKIYFGDASRLDPLQAARADPGEVFVLARDVFVELERLVNENPRWHAKQRLSGSLDHRITGSPDHHSIAAA